MSNYDKYYITAVFHSSPHQFIVTQMTKAKDWVFIDPAVAKKYLPVDTTEKVAVINPMATPRYFFRTEAGEGLYFPEWWYHTVYTEPGINITSNWRMHVYILNTFNASPMSMKQRLIFFVKFSTLRYIFPEWFVKMIIGRGHDSHQSKVHQSFDYRKSIFELNAGDVTEWK